MPGNRWGVDRSSAPVRCIHCDQLFADTSSFKDHIMDCERMKPGSHRPNKAKVTT